MGLDVYLYRYENFEDSRKRELEYSKKSEDNWNFPGKTYNELSEDVSSF
jgi:hypothetical protein